MEYIKQGETFHIERLLQDKDGNNISVVDASVIEVIVTISHSDEIILKFSSLTREGYETLARGGTDGNQVSFWLTRNATKTMAVGLCKVKLLLNTTDANAPSSEVVYEFDLPPFVITLGQNKDETLE